MLPSVPALQALPPNLLQCGGRAPVIPAPLRRSIKCGGADTLESLAFHEARGSLWRLERAAADLRPKQYMPHVIACPWPGRRKVLRWSPCGSEKEIHMHILSSWGAATGCDEAPPWRRPRSSRACARPKQLHGRRTCSVGRPAAGSKGQTRSEQDRWELRAPPTH